MKRILLATDFSERSDRAVRRATLLAKTFGASLTLVHVVDDDRPRRAVEAEHQAAEELLREQARSLRDVDGLTCDSRVFFGDAFEGISRAAREESADLLVIGPHRRQALKDVFVGTTAERTIRASDRPVLMANDVPAGPYRHALVAVDMSDGSADAVRALQRLGIADAIAVSAVHVFDAPGTGLLVRTHSSMEQIKEYLAGEQERAAGELAAFLGNLGLDTVRTVTKRLETSVANAICLAADEAAADLVVIGTRGRTGIAKVFLGSVAEETLRISHRDVLAIPPCRGGAPE